MRDMLEKLMEKKKDKKPMDEAYKGSKMKALEDLHKVMSGLIGQDLKGSKKVMVAGDDDESLMAGLDKAKDLVQDHDMPPGLEDDQDKEEDSEDEAVPFAGKETPEEEMAEEHEMDEAMTPEEIDAKIAELNALKMKKSMKA